MAENEIKILLIEDNPGDVRLVKEMLNECEDLHVNLVVVDNLTRGLRYIATEFIDIILLDLNLPESEGIETFTRVHQFAIDVPIIILSVLSDKELIYEAMKGGAQNYLIKGKVHCESLMCAIRYAVWNGNNAING